MIDLCISLEYAQDIVNSITALSPEEKYPKFFLNLLKRLIEKEQQKREAETLEPWLANQGS